MTDPNPIDFAPPLVRCPGSSCTRPVRQLNFSAVLHRVGRLGPLSVPVQLRLDHDVVVVVVVQEQLRLFVPGLATLSVALSPTRCGADNRRWWVLCPTCGRRCRDLFLESATIECRRCSALIYTSQLLPRQARLLMQAKAIRLALDGSSDLTRGFPQRPPVLRSTTYRRMRAKYVELLRAAAD